MNLRLILTSVLFSASAAAAPSIPELPLDMLDIPPAETPQECLLRTGIVERLPRPPQAQNSFGDIDIDTVEFPWIFTYQYTVSGSSPMRRIVLEDLVSSRAGSIYATLLDENYQPRGIPVLIASNLVAPRVLDTYAVRVDGQVQNDFRFDIRHGTIDVAAASRAYLEKPIQFGFKATGLPGWVTLTVRYALPPFNGCTDQDKLKQCELDLNRCMMEVAKMYDVSVRVLGPTFPSIVNQDGVVDVAWRSHLMRNLEGFGKNKEAQRYAAIVKKHEGEPLMERLRAELAVDREEQNMALPVLLTNAWVQYRDMPLPRVDTPRQLNYQLPLGE